MNSRVFNCRPIFPFTYLLYLRFDSHSFHLPNFLKFQKFLTPLSNTVGLILPSLSLSLSLSHTHTHTLTHTHPYTLSHNYFLSFTLSITFFLSLSLNHKNSLSLSDTFSLFGTPSGLLPSALCIEHYEDTIETGGLQSARE